MPPIYIPTTSPADWRSLLADPEKHWRSGYSAKELAECWQAANGFPAEFTRLFARAPHPLNDLELLLAIPEYPVAFKGSGGASKNKLFVLARAGECGLAVIMVEGKAAEPFGATLETWLKDASPGKLKRLEYLCSLLGLASPPPMTTRYQLLHRAASAVITARSFHAAFAIMAVHSFSPAHRWLTDYQEFIALFGVTGGVNELVELPLPGSLRFYAAWVSGTPKPG